MAKDRIKQTRGGKHRVERAERQQRVLVFGTVLFLGTVIALVVGGAIFENYIRPNLAVAIVGEEEISFKEFEVRVQYERVQWVSQYIQLQQTLEFVGSDPTMQGQFQSQMDQIAFILDPIPFAESILNQMIDDRLIRQEAIQRGITVSEEEIDRSILARYNFYPRGIPTLKPTITLQSTSTLSADLYAILSPTPTATITPTFTVTPIYSSTPEIVSTSGIQTLTPTLEPTATLEATATSNIPTFTPTVLTTEIAGENMLGELIQLEQIGFDETELRKLQEFNLFREKIFNALIDDIDKHQEQVWIRRMVFSFANEVEANDALDMLENEMEWSAVVQIYASNAALIQEDNLGWMANYPQDPEFDQEFIDAVFNLDFGEYSQVIETPSGWNIIQILGKEERQLTRVQLTRINEYLFDQFLVQIRDATETTLRDNWQERVPDQPSLQLPPSSGIFP